MVLVIIIVVAWIVILAPSLMKRRSSVGEIGSISHFHRQLRVLEHSGPQPIVAPAYRLRSVDGSGPAQAPGGPEVAAPVLSVVGASELPRPALAFLGDDPDEQAAGPAARPRLVFDDVAGPGGPRTAVTITAATTTTTTPTAAVGALGRVGPTEARLLVRRRRRDTLAVMAAVFGLTLAIGFVPAARPAWIVTALSGAALAAYVALLVHLRRMAEERERKLHYLRPEGSGTSAAAGAARVPTYMSGRYAHPSNQAFATR